MASQEDATAWAFVDKTYHPVTFQLGRICLAKCSSKHPLRADDFYIVQAPPLGYSYSASDRAAFSLAGLWTRRDPRREWMVGLTTDGIYQLKGFYSATSNSAASD